jgi:uncharacterized membrane protein
MPQRTREQRIAYHKDYYQKHKNKIKEQRKAYALANPEKIKKMMNDWSKRNPEKKAAWKSKHRIKTMAINKLKIQKVLEILYALTNRNIIQNNESITRTRSQLYSLWKSYK